MIVTGNITLLSQLGTSAIATAKGKTGGVAAAGASVSNAQVTPVVNTFIAGGSIGSTAGSILLSSYLNVNGSGATIGQGASAIAGASAGSVIFGQGGATATATDSPSVATTVLGGTLNASSAVNLLANVLNVASANSNGNGSGFVGLGFTKATATDNGTTTALKSGSIGSGTAVGASNLSVQAVASDFASSVAQASSGGLGAGQNNNTNSYLNPQINAYIAGPTVNVASNIQVSPG